MTKARRFRYLYSWSCLAGGAITLASFAVLFSFAVVDLIADDLPYAGLGYICAGGGILFGLAIVALGVFRRWRADKRGLPYKRLSLIINLNETRQRNLVLLSGSIGILLLVGIFGGSYQGVIYLESNNFCVNTCHQVMAPEGMAHSRTAHSRVHCVSCHVGSGAASFLEAKLRGASQLLAVITGNYDRPIKTPIHSMKPARITCEQCHWRQRWIGFKEKFYTYYSSDDDNAVNQLRMLIKIGGAQTGIVKGAGIHYHMTIGRKVDFIARDERKQDIAWIRVTNDDGTIAEYNNKAQPLTESERKSLPIHNMDCMDCHNRPAHQFGAPMRVVNTAMVTGEIDTSIPGIKGVGVGALSADYESSAAAMEGIEKAVLEHYKDKDYFETNRQKLDTVVGVLQRLFSATQFPEMKARWSAYPDNLGHRDWPGCFRCHSEDMVDASDKPIFTTCTRCHVLLAQTNGDTNVVDYEEGEEFYHVVDEETLTEYTDCAECHDGGDGAY